MASSIKTEDYLKLSKVEKRLWFAPNVLETSASAPFYPDSEWLCIELVMERMRSFDFFCRLESDVHGPGWVGSFGHHKGMKYGWGVASNLVAIDAIEMAAARALGLMDHPELKKAIKPTGGVDKTRDT